MADATTSLLQIVYRCWDVLSFRNVTMREEDALNAQACAWARNHRAQFPVNGPLRLRPMRIQAGSREARG